EAAAHLDRDAGLLGEVAEEEVGLGELRRDDALSGKGVDALDVGADDDAVGAAGEADLGRDDDLELPSIDGEDVGGGGGGGHASGVERRPALLLGERELDLEAVLL